LNTLRRFSSASSPWNVETGFAILRIRVIGGFSARTLAQAVQRAADP